MPILKARGISRLLLLVSLSYGISMSPVSTSRSRICRLVDRHRAIDRLIARNPDCPAWASLAVDQLLVEAEREEEFFLSD